MVAESFREYLSRHYTIYICSDSLKQTDRIRAIFEDRGDNISFTAVERTLHEGFADDTLRICIFTDHQLFDRFHKYNLKSDKARGGKVALSLKELNQFTPGDYVVHTDHGVGRFAGLVRIPNGDTTQEVMKIVYQNEDVVFVSIHSLHKVSKYKGKEGSAPPQQARHRSLGEAERPHQDEDKGYCPRLDKTLLATPRGEGVPIQSRQLPATGVGSLLHL